MTKLYARTKEGGRQFLGWEASYKALKIKHDHLLTAYEKRVFDNITLTRELNELKAKD